MFRRCLFAHVVCLALVAGCRDASSPVDSAARSMNGLMPAAAPAPDFSYLADQTTIKILPERTISTEPYDTFVAKAAEKKAAESRAAMTPSRGTKTAKAGGARVAAGGGTWWQRIAARALGESPPAADESAASESESDSDEAAEEPGSADAGDADKDEDSTNEDAEKESEPVEAAEGGGDAAKLVDPRPIMARVPPNSENQSEADIEHKRESAEKAARAALLQTVGSFAINPATTLRDLTGSDAESFKLDLLAIQVVSYQWLDATRLQATVQIRVGDVITELQQKYPDAELSPLKGIDQDKCFEAAGTSTATESGPKRAVPGARARDAAEGGGF